MTGLAVPIPYNWQVGDTGNAALLDAQVRDPMTFWLNVPIFVTTQTSVQAVATGSLVTVTWPAPAVDTYGGWSAGTPTRYTPQVPGYYDLFASIGIAANATGNRATVLEQNGATVGQQALPAVSTADVAVTQAYAPNIYFNGTTDYFEAVALQRSGGSLNTVVARTLMTARWVHA